MAQARITRDGDVVEVNGISSAAAYALAREFATKPREQVARVAASHGEELDDEQALAFGFSPIEGFITARGVSR